MLLHDLRTKFRSHQDLILRDLKELVEIESPSGDRMALETLKGTLIDRLRGLSASVQIEHTNAPDGHIVARFKGRAERSPALVVGHYDTVWPMGTLQTMPFRIDDGRAFGPGSYDMKAGLAMFLRVVELLSREGAAVPRPVWAVFTCDEEIGSPTSRRLIEELARESAYVLVLEPPLADGGLKTARKGVGHFHVDVEGRAAHAGVAPWEGRSAIVELARQILHLESLQDPVAGTTLNVGIIKGGTTRNVVPAHASAEIDVRVASEIEADRVEKALRSLGPTHPDLRVTVSGGINRPPMERTPAIASLFEQARRIGEEIGLDLTEGATGGGSDGNFTAALGIPTLDGLGARGGGAHATNEHIVIDSLGERAALLAALLLGLKAD